MFSPLVGPGLSTLLEIKSQMEKAGEGKGLVNALGSKENLG